MKNLLLILLLSFGLNSFGQLYQATSGSISFFSETPVENIDAENKGVKALLNTKNGDIAFIIANIGFHFKKPLMEEHFNENYIESDKYKTSMFKGKIDQKIDYTTKGKYKVIVKGILNIHGVDKEREIEGVLTIKDGKIHIESEFDVTVADHNIKIPKLVVTNIAEVVKVKVDIIMELKN